MTPIEKLISDLKKFCENEGSYNRQERGAVQLILGEYESSPTPVGFPAEIDAELEDGEWFTLDSDGSGELHFNEPKMIDSFGGCWTSEGGRFIAIFKTPDDWTKARWQLIDGKWVQK